MSQNMVTLGRSAALAGRSAVAAALGTAALIIARAVLDRRQPFDWHFAFTLPVALGFGWFCISLAYWLFKLRARAPAEEILDDISADGVSPAAPLSGFVAMEYFAATLNRTFVVFVAPDGLYGWRVEGPVSARNRLYFEPYAKMTTQS
jgi:hypothetical protein